MAGRALPTPGGARRFRERSRCDAGFRGPRLGSNRNLWPALRRFNPNVECRFAAAGVTAIVVIVLASLADLPSDRKRAECGASGYQVDCRLAARESLGRLHTGVLRGRTDRGAHRPPGATEDATGGLANVCDEPAGPKESRSRRSRVSSMSMPCGGKRPARRRARTHFDSTDSCTNRHPPVGPGFRARGGGDVAAANRSRPGRGRRDSGPGHARGASAVSSGRHASVLRPIEEYLLGRHLLWKFIEEDRVRAIEHFNRAIAPRSDSTRRPMPLSHTPGGCEGCSVL